MLLTASSQATFVLSTTWCLSEKTSAFQSGALNVRNMVTRNTHPLGSKKCTNCSSEFHKSDKCDRSPSCVSCGPSSNHPSSSTTCPLFTRICEMLNGHYPKNAMPYFLSREVWTWATVPTNPPPLPKAPHNTPSMCPQQQRPRCKEVRFNTPPPLSQSQAYQPDDGWTSVHRRQSSPQCRR